jgi:hypothetical protein
VHGDSLSRTLKNLAILCLDDRHHGWVEVKELVHKVVPMGVVVCNTGELSDASDYISKHCGS